MSRFFIDDTVALEEDPSILGTVDFTWRDFGEELSKGFDECYLHKDLPASVQNAWADEGILLQGYVIIEFVNERDGFCLVSETALRLIDRGLAVGDVVKRTGSETQTGTVVSTSIQCALRPLYDCTHWASHAAADVPRPPQQTKDEGNGPVEIPTIVPLLEVPASELTHWNDYREEDFVIYKDWFGQIRSILDSVTLRLTNGSVVTVKDPLDLAEPDVYRQYQGNSLVDRLARLNYCRVNSPAAGSDPPEIDHLHLGQIVQCRKANLRLGNWKFGRYDPNVVPRGVIVEVRCVQLEVDWIVPNVFQGREASAMPPILIDVDDLRTDELIVYDRSRRSDKTLSSQLPSASYSPDTGFGSLVRFKDPAGAAVKYSKSPEHPHSPSFNRISRMATQGFDMNVLQVVRTKTVALVQWQDGSFTKQETISLDACIDPDQHDVWPGDTISYVPDEQTFFENGNELVRSSTVGVVQSVNSRDRIANIRWYKQSIVEMNVDKTIRLSRSVFGPIGETYSDVSLYEVAAHPCLATDRGDMVIVIPELPWLSPSYIEHHNKQQIELPRPKDPGRPHSPTPPGQGASPVNELYPDSLSVIHKAIVQGVRSLSASIDSQLSGPSSRHHVPVLSPAAFGEIVQTCPDGDVIVRLGASCDACEVKLPMERIVVIKSDDSNDSDEDSEWTEDEDVSEYSEHAEISEDENSIDDSKEIQTGRVKCEGRQEAGISHDEDEGSSYLSCQQGSILLQQQIVNSAQSASLDLQPPDFKTTSFASYSNFPASFSILHDPAPQDHHFIKESTSLTAEMMRRIAKEHKILSSSLPDGVFVRSWENRLDLLRILIVGPSDTPYEFAPFVFDFHLNTTFPSAPPSTYFYSWAHDSGHINPNLYKDGTVCLSLLGTWYSTNDSETWSKKSTVLQIIVSIMGLVLVKEPYYSEYCPYACIYCPFMMT